MYPSIGLTTSPPMHSLCATVTRYTVAMEEEVSCGRLWWLRYAVGRHSLYTRYAVGGHTYREFMILLFTCRLLEPLIH